MKKYRWSTMSKDNVKKGKHSWTVRLVGKPEINYLNELLFFLEDNNFVYRFKVEGCTYYINKNAYYDETFHRDDINIDIRPSVIDRTEIYHTHGTYVDMGSGEILAERGQTVSVMVYKNTTALKYAERKGVV